MLANKSHALASLSKATNLYIYSACNLTKVEKSLNLLIQIYLFSFRKNIYFLIQQFGIIKFSININFVLNSSCSSINICKRSLIS